MIMITPEDSTKILIFEQQRKELEREVNDKFYQSSYPKQVEFYARIKKYYDAVQEYAKEISQRNPAPLDLIIQVKELVRKAEVLKLKMKKRIV